MKENIGIVSSTQFGYFTDYYYFSKYMSSKSNLFYICYDDGLKKINIENVTVHYVNKRFKNNYIENLNFIINSTKLILKNKLDFVLISYFMFSFLIRFLLPFKKLIMDIRSAGITKNEKKRKRNHRTIRFNTLFFDHTTILAESLMDELKLNPKRTSIIPLGAEDNNFHNKIFDKINILYVGILNSRNIHETIIGFKIFLDRNPNLRQEVTYDIVGFGTRDVESIVNQEILDNKLDDIVIFHGRKTIEESKFFWNKCNVGIVYVPTIPAYQNQPPTKLFEALFSGMPVIATITNENKKFVNDDNGILVNDNPEEFAAGLELLIRRKKMYNSIIIKNSVKDYSWEKITDNLINLLRTL